MIDLNTTNEWQHRCPETGLVLPWYTRSFLDELVTWDLKDKVVFEYGAGASTLWWNKKAKTVEAVDNDWSFCGTIRAHSEGIYCYCAYTKETYVKFIEKPGYPFDIVIVDGEPVEWRDGCISKAVQFLKPDGRLIIDNWDQPSVWVPSDETRKLLSNWPHKIYKQEGHPDWQTAVFTKP